MLLIASALALLVVFSGVKLLAQTQKEALGNLYKYVSWFLIIMGFLLLIGVGCRGLMHFFHHSEKMMEGKYHMMEEKHFGNPGMMGNQMGSCMMHDYHGKMGCSGGMPMGGGHHGGEMEGCCCEREGCQEKAEGECHHWGKGNCDEDSKECSMKKGEMAKKDSIKKNKYSH